MQPRLLGGFLVLPTPDALACVAPIRRAALIRETLDALRQHEAELLELRADTILDLRRRYNVKWASIARRFRLSLQAAFRIGAERKEQLAKQAVCPAEVLADVA